MIVHIDTTVLVAALVVTEPHHEVCADLLNESRLGIFSHGLAEAFNTLTGGRLGFRLRASEVAEQLRTEIRPLLDVVNLDADEMLAAFIEAESRGVRGGAIFDYLHLAAARKGGAERLYTLDRRHFLAFHQRGDPEVWQPGVR